MTPGTGIDDGPRAFDIAANMFKPAECEHVWFKLVDGSEVYASIRCARSLDDDGHWWELELSMPSPQTQFEARYNCHTKKGEVQWVTKVEPDPIELEWGSGKLTRLITQAECPWLKEDLPVGKAVFKYDAHTYGTISETGVAVTEEVGAPPFFEVPADAVSWEK